MACAAKGVTDEELTRAKEFLKGKITLSLEDSEERAHFYGKQELLYPKVRTIDDYFKEIDAVSSDQINGLASSLLKPEEMRLVVIGKEDNKDRLEKMIGK